MLYNQRRRAADRARREAAGESFWTDSFSNEARMRLLHLIQGHGDLGQAISARAHELIIEDEAMPWLVDGSYYPQQDFVAYLGQCEDDMMPTVIEAWWDASGARDLQVHLGVYNATNLRPWFTKAVNEVLVRERIAFELIDGQMVEMNSRELHAEVVAPVLRLLARSDRRWDGVETAFRGALDELSRGEAGDAITDAGTALQEALEAAGADGNALGPLIASARKKGLLAGHDQKLGDSVAKALDWVSSDRSQTGDAHHVTAAESDDAWLIVHIVGALILRLSKGGKRA